MGFVRSTLLLKFDDPEFEGFEVRSRRLSIDSLLTISELQSIDLRDTEAAKVAFVDLTKELATVLTSWNLEDEAGAAVPLNADTLAVQDFRMVFAIAGGLLDASAGVSPPLSPPSNGGEPSVEASIPMETLSGSPAS